MKKIAAAPSVFLSAVLVACSLCPTHGQPGVSHGVHHQPAFGLNTQNNVRNQAYPGTGALVFNPATRYPSGRFLASGRVFCRTRGIEDMTARGAHRSISVENESTENTPEMGVTRQMFVSMLASSVLAAATLQPSGGLAAAGRRSIEEVKKDVETDFVQR